MTEMLVKFIRTLCMFLLAGSSFGMTASAGKCFEMSPAADLFLFTGSTLQLNCSLKLPNNNSDCPGDQFILNETKIMKGSHDLPQDLFQYYVAENTIQMTIENVSHEDSGMYVCRYGDNQIVQAVRNVNIGEAPAEPENLMCISQNHEDLACSFSLSKPSDIPMDWEIKYEVLIWREKHSASCSEKNGIVTCGKVPQEHYHHNAKYDITVQGENVNYSVNIRKDFRVKANESIVKPNPVDELSYSINSVSDITVRWQAPGGLIFDGKGLFLMDYEVRVTSRWNNFTKMIRNVLESSIEYNLTDLIPYTNHTVTVVVKPTAAVGDIYWSGPTSISFITPKTVPERSVSMTTGSYSLSKCDEQTLCPVIYWKNPPEMFWNGPVVGYMITIEEIDIHASLSAVHGHVKKRTLFIDQPEYRIKRLIEPVMKNISGLSVSAPITNLRMNEDYKVKVTFINSEGTSRESSELLIPHWNEGQQLQVEWVSVEVGDTDVDVTWSMKPNTCANITSITIYWCLIDDEKTFNDTRSVVHCKDMLDWFILSVTGSCENRTSYSFQQSYDYSKLRFAVSVETNKISGGLVWEKFRFKKETVPDTPLYSVDPSGNELVIQILYGPYYDSDGGRPDKYTVSYSDCSTQTKCSTDEKTVSFPANFTTPVHKIGKLQAGSLYKVYVTAINRYGMSNKGEPAIKKILKEDDSKNTVMIVSIVLGCLVVVAVALILCFCCRKKHKQMKADMKITLPDPFMNETYMVKEGDTGICKSEDNHDSGKGSDSPGSSQGHINTEQTGGTNNEDNQCNGPHSSLVGKDGDESHLIPTEQKSPILSGYRRQVSDVTSAGHAMAENSEDEIDDDPQNDDPKVYNTENVPEQEVPSEKIDDDNEKESFAKTKNENERDDLALKNGGQGLDYSLATLGRNDQGLNNSSTVVQIKKEDVRQFFETEERVLNMEETEHKEGIELTLVSSSQRDTASAVDFTEDEFKIGSGLDSSDSYGEEFEDICVLHDESSSAYKKPDQVSLGDGSTITDISDTGNLDCEDIGNVAENFDIEEEKGETTNDQEVNDACSVIEDIDQYDAETCENSNIDNTNIKQDEEAKQGDQLSKSVTGDDVELPHKEGQDENVLQNSKSLSEPNNLEPYIIAGYGSNGFVKPSKIKGDETTVDLKKEMISKLKAQKDLPGHGPFQAKSGTSN